MKNLIYFIVFTILVVIGSCTNQEHKQKSMKSFQIYKGDTSNIMDEKGLKQGKWYIFKLASNGVPMNNTPLDTLYYRNDTIIDI